MEEKKKGMMDTVVMAVGLIIVVAIAVFIINWNTEYYTNMVKTMDASNVVIIQQRDALIKKLMKKAQLKEKEAAEATGKLGSIQSELDASNRKLEAVKTVVQ